MSAVDKANEKVGAVWQFIQAHELIERIIRCLGTKESAWTAPSGSRASTAGGRKSNKCPQEQCPSKAVTGKSGRAAGLSGAELIDGQKMLRLFSGHQKKQRNPALSSASGLDEQMRTSQAMYTHVEQWSCRKKEDLNFAYKINHTF